MESDDLRSMCGSCSSTNVQTEVVVQEFPYGVGQDQVTLHAMVPVRTCGDCHFSYTDYEGEEARDAAVELHKKESQQATKVMTDFIVGSYLKNLKRRNDE